MNAERDWEYFDDRPTDEERAEWESAESLADFHRKSHRWFTREYFADGTPIPDWTRYANTIVLPWPLPTESIDLQLRDGQETANAVVSIDGDGSVMYFAPLETPVLARAKSLGVSVTCRFETTVTLT